MTEYTGNCIRCGMEFTLSEENPIPFFNRARKYDWRNYRCQRCGALNKVARFSKNSNLLFAIEE